MTYLPSILNTFCCKYLCQHTACTSPKWHSWQESLALWFSQTIWNNCKSCVFQNDWGCILETYGLSTMPMHSRLRGLLRWRILKDLVANWGQFTTISMSVNMRYKIKGEQVHMLPSISAVLLPLSANNQNVNDTFK